MKKKSAKPAKRSAPKNASKVILVVDDEEGVRVLLRDALERSGFTVVEAADGWEALRLLRLFKRPPDLVLTDLMMPSMNGRELMDALSIGGEKPKVLAMSGYERDELPATSLPSGAFEFIRKPFGALAVAAKVKEMLA